VLPLFLLGLALLVGLVLIGRWYVTAEPKVLAKVLTRLAFGLIVVVIVFLAVTGRIGWALGAAAGALPWVLRFVRAARTAKNFSRMAGAGGGQTSTVNTRFLRVSLDHETGGLDGDVIEGPFAGLALSAHGLAELVELLNQCWVEDQQSTQVLDAYLDRVHPDWRTKPGAEFAGQGAGAGGGTHGDGEMTREEAYDVLGLQSGAGEAEIKAAYHRIISALHPDKGGSNFLAAKVNQAKDLLLGS
jgi:hypothetical protein